MMRNNIVSEQEHDKGYHYEGGHHDQPFKDPPDHDRIEWQDLAIGKQGAVGIDCSAHLVRGATKSEIADQAQDQPDCDIYAAYDAMTDDCKKERQERKM